MKVLLIDAGRGYMGAASGGGAQGNIGLEYIASFVQSMGHEVAVLEPPLNDVSDEEIVIKADGFDAVGISCMVWNAEKANAMAAAIRKNFPRVRLAVGGNGPTGMPEFFSGHFDTVITGEGEKAFLKWLEGSDARKIIPASRDMEWDGTIFPLRNEEVIKNSFMRGIWPIPYSQQSVANIIYSKGCFGQCSFCSSPLTWLRKVIWRNPESVAEELLWLHEEFGVNSVDFIDATFNASNERVLALCEVLDRHEISKKIKWTAMVSPSQPGAELIFPAMRKAGCIKVGIGLEDPSPEIRKSFLKNGNSDRCQQTIELADANDLLVRVYVMIGAPNQSLANIEAIDGVLATWPIDEPRISMFTPFPGTLSWTKMQDQIIERDFRKYDTNFPVVKSAFSPAELITLRHELTKAFFMGNNYQQRKMLRITRDSSFKEAYRQFEERFLIPKGYIVL